MLIPTDIIALFYMQECFCAIYGTFTLPSHEVSEIDFLQFISSQRVKAIEALDTQSSWDISHNVS